MRRCGSYQVCLVIRNRLRGFFSSGLLEYPQYTRPADFRGMKVPDILLSGDHGKIDDWRLEQALKRTYERRPDMLTGLSLSGKAKQMLADIKADESEV